MLVLSGTILIDYFFGVNEMDFIVPSLRSPRSPLSDFCC
jgi:hypothetical protein